MYLTLKIVWPLPSDRRRVTSSAVIIAGLNHCNFEVTSPTQIVRCTPADLYVEAY